MLKISDAVPNNIQVRNEPSALSDCMQLDCNSILLSQSFSFGKKVNSEAARTFVSPHFNSGIRKSTRLAKRNSNRQTSSSPPSCSIGTTVRVNNGSRARPSVNPRRETGSQKVARASREVCRPSQRSPAGGAAFVPNVPAGRVRDGPSAGSGSRTRRRGGSPTSARTLISRRITRTPVVVVPPSIVNLPLRLLGRTSLLTSAQFANISPEYLQSLFTAIFAR